MGPIATSGLTKVSAIQMTNDRFFCPSDWLASCQFRVPPSAAPTLKLTMHSTSEISAMVSSVNVELEFSLRRKSDALALMMTRLTNQRGNEYDFPCRKDFCIPDGR